MRRALSILKNSLPFLDQERALKRAFVPYKSNPANDGYLLEQAVTMIAATKEAGGIIEGSTVVEIGTGWIPIMPLMFRAAGATEVISVDQHRLMDKQTFLYAMAFIKEHLHAAPTKTGGRELAFDLTRMPGRNERTLSDLCQSGGISYRAPADFMGLPPRSADFIISRTVLEHIPENTLREIFRHAATVIKPNGLMCHIIDMSDHFEHRDKTLSRLDMLRYTEDQWRTKTRDPQDYQNRLRRFDFSKLFQETGWEILVMDGEPDTKALNDLKTMNIMARYAETPHDELAILTSLFVLRRAR